MRIEYQVATSNNLDEIMLLIKDAISNMINNHIFQWDEIYPTAEDFAEDIRQNNLYIGISEGKTAVVFALNKQCSSSKKNVKRKGSRLSDWMLSAITLPH